MTNYLNLNNNTLLIINSYGIFNTFAQLMTFES